MATSSPTLRFVIGVDTHTSTHTASVVTAQGAETGRLTVSADVQGYRRLAEFAQREAAGQRLWAVEGCGSYGAGLCTYLQEHHETVVEVDPRLGPASRGGKSDELDATRAARSVLAQRRPIEPRQRGPREAIRVLVRTRIAAVRGRTRSITQLKSLVVTAPEALRSKLRALPTDRLVVRCARLRTTREHSMEHRCTVLALRHTARRVLGLEAEAQELESHLELLVEQLAPDLLAQPGVGVITCAEILCAWSHPGRVRSEAAFAALAGVCPIPASSGQVTRHRLNRGGDRRLNCALHIIVLSRMTHHAETRAYVARRRTEGKTDREIRRCLKRAVARRLFRLLEARGRAA